ncbi:MAG TPA: anthranilate phosphoribosyltransferase [Coleofasciculaceae cyanobacterium]|jgi:anthranilate phosphoribosyltransferase
MLDDIHNSSIDDADATNIYGYPGVSCRAPEREKPFPSIEGQSEYSENPDWIDDLIHSRLPEAEAKRLLLALTPDKITAGLFSQLVTSMLRTVVPVPTLETPVMDCCGTGGSGLPHYNTSTTVVFVLAAGGVKVVKFGNRAASSKSGSFDFLEALGLPSECELERLPETLEKTGLAFLYAPQCYPALAPLARLRREVQTRTVFNFLGPLLNPVKPAYRLLGVSHPDMQSLMADYLAEQQPHQRAWLVYGMEGQAGLDEITPQGETRLLEVSEGRVQRKTLTYRFDGEVDLNRAHTPEDNLAIFRALIEGQDMHSIYYRMVCLNAGAGLHIAGRTACLETGVQMAEELLAYGKVKETVSRCRKIYGGRNAGD